MILVPKIYLVYSEVISKNQFESLAIQLMELHYDTRYLKSRSLSPISITHQIKLEKITNNELLKAAQKVKSLVGLLDEK